MTWREKKLLEIGLKLIDARPLAGSESDMSVLGNAMTLVALEMKREGRRAAKGRERRRRYKEKLANGN